MFNKKIKIVILGTVALLLLCVLFFVVLKNKNAGNNKNTSIQTKGSLNKTEETNLSKDLEELKNNHPEFSIAQLKSFEEISKNDSNQEIIKQCQERDDQNDCIISAAFIKNDIALCHSHPDSPEKHFEESDPQFSSASHFFLNEKSGKECANALLKKNVKKDVEQCMLLSGDNFFNCLRNIFLIYKEKQECSDLPDKGTREICEEIFDYEKIYLEYNRELCSNIKNEKLKEYCLKIIIDKSQDTDGDGLTDLDEINKYKTSHLLPDTDGDGYSDGEEVKNGFNPRGEGKMP